MRDTYDHRQTLDLTWPDQVSLEQTQAHADTLPGGKVRMYQQTVLVLEFDGIAAGHIVTHVHDRVHDTERIEAEINISAGLLGPYPVLRGVHVAAGLAFGDALERAGIDVRGCITFDDYVSWLEACGYTVTRVL